MRTRLRHLPFLLAALACVTALAGVAGGLAAGTPGAAGAAAGVALVVASYLFSTLAIAWADTVNPRLVLPVGMAAYVVKFGILGLVMIVLLNSGWSGLVPMAAGIAVGVLAWNGAQIWWVYGPGRPSAGPAAK